MMNTTVHRSSDKNSDYAEQQKSYADTTFARRFELQRTINADPSKMCKDPTK